MARKEAMATIDTLMNAPAQPAASPSIGVPPPPPELVPTAKKKQTKEEKDEARQAAAKEKEEKEARLQAAKEEEKAQQEQATALKELPSTLKEIWRNTQVNLGNIPTYGSIMFPLSILLIFFFLLLPVNGHTRAMWIWLVLTGHAEIASTGASGGGKVASPDVSAQTLAQLPSPSATGNFLDIPRVNIRPISPYLGGTFVEDL